MEPSESDPLLQFNGAGSKWRFSRIVKNLQRYRSPVALGLIFIVSVSLLITIIAITSPPSEASENQEDGNLLRQSSPSGSAQNRITVRTGYGRLEGTSKVSRAGREFYAFYGVPYAKPPVGDLRFSAPQDPESWRGTRNASVPHPHCAVLDKITLTIDGSEDCLLLNIYTPKLPTGRSSGSFNFQNFRGNRNKVKLPVLIYFYGGAFQFGDANDFNPAYFLDEDVVIIIPQYRVNALGFLSTGDEEVPGNMGLRDQIQVLKWTHEEISAFGGDPSRIVPMGESAGAFSTHAHLLSPLTADYISGVISLSNPMLLSLPLHGIKKDHWEMSKRLGEEAGCPTNSSKDLVTCLRGADLERIIMSSVEFGPSYDGFAENPVLPSSLIQMALAGKGNKVPWLVGGTNAEMIRDAYKILTDPVQTEDFNNNFNAFVKSSLMLGEAESETEMAEILGRVRSFYFQNETITKDSPTRFNLTNMLSDRFYYHTTKTAGLRHAELGDVYLYLLTKEGDMNVSYVMQFTEQIEPPYGVSHADDIQYFFQWSRYPYIGLDSPFLNFSQLYVKFLVSFAANGYPVNPDPDGAEWPKLNPADNGRFWYNLDDTPSIIEPFKDRLDFWDKIPYPVLFNCTETGDPVSDPK